MQELPIAHEAPIAETSRTPSSGPPMQVRRMEQDIQPSYPAGLRMPIFLWLARFVGSTVAFAFNLLASSGLFLLSAHLFTLDAADAHVPASIVRGIAAVWMFGAALHYVKHGVLQRPKPVPQQKPKVSGKEAAASSVGCIASLIAIAATALWAGPYADWVYAGLVGDDPAHPARIALERAREGLYVVAQDPSRFAGYYVAFIVAMLVLRLLTAWGRRKQTPSSPQEQHKARRRKHRHRPNAGTSQAPPAPTSSVPGGGAPRPSRGPTSAPRVSNSGRTIEDPMIGALRRDDAAGGWRLVNPRSDVGSVVILSADQPTDAQMDATRALVRRSFEVLLRASEAARPVAQANGIGLPRFTVAESVVGPGAGGHPKVTMRLRCEGDAARVYEVTSADGMQTFSS